MAVALTPGAHPLGSAGLLHAAGVLPFAGRQVLLGLEKRGWSAFSGTGAPHETPTETAARELSEETARILHVDQADLAASQCIVTFTPMRREFYLYLVDMTRGASLEDVAAEFQRRRQGTAEAPLREKLRVCWFDLHEVGRLRLAPSFCADLGRIVTAFHVHHVHRSLSRPAARAPAASVAPVPSANGPASPRVAWGESAEWARAPRPRLHAARGSSPVTHAPRARVPLAPRRSGGHSGPRRGMG